jgi:hypothetical protein
MTLSARSSTFGGIVTVQILSCICFSPIGNVRRTKPSMGFAFSQRLTEFGGGTLVDVGTGAERNNLHH